MRLTDFWPAADQDHMSCFVTEAETAAEEVFLAVHQPMKLTRSYYGGNTEPVPQTEEDVLEALLVKNPPSGTLILPIVGDSGVGKSHMIRWLDARLKLLPDRGKHHIVRIPKSSSLKEVLRLILVELIGSKYDTLRHRLNEAKIPKSRLQATRKLHGELLVALEIAFDEASNRIRQGTAKLDDKARKNHCSEHYLRALLKDPTIDEGYFTSHEGEDEAKWGVLTRISDRCLSGSKRAGSGPAETEFLPEDFAFISDFELDLFGLNQSTRNYILILRRDPTALADAIRFLNEVLETARSGLIDLGGVSLSELFIDIRKGLLEDGMELVLLVEDFAVLAGIQGPLLDAMIREGIRNGKQELCTMRTALAVTEGRLSDETVRTRAQARWKIDSTPFGSEEEAITTFANFVGGYLNAARWGAARLSEMFSARDNRGNSSDWARCFFDSDEDMDEAEKQQLLAFGTSSRGNHPLFPFNRETIRQLARQHLYDNPTNTYRFDPRKLINRLLIPTIRDNRTLWERGLFPAPDFSDFHSKLLAPEVSLHAQSQLAEADMGRAAPLIYFWSDNPRSPGEAAAMAVEIHDAFRIPRIDWGAKPVRRAVTPAPSADQPNTVFGPTPPGAKDPADAWAKILDDWRINGILGQTEGNKLRTLLSEAVCSWLDPNALLIPKAESIPLSLIYLPKSRHNNPDLEKAAIVAATEEEFEGGKTGPRLITAIKAVVRYHELKTWNYDGGETDYALYTNFISKLAKQAEGHFLSKGRLLHRDGIKSAAQALLVGARILNLPGATANTDAENLSAMLTEATGDSGISIDSPTPWQRLRTGAHRSRDDMRKAVLELLAAMQGTGTQPYAINPLPLLEAITELRAAKWEITDNPLPHFIDPTNILREHLRDARNPSLVTKRADQIIQWADKVEAAFGTDFDPSDLVANMRAAIVEAKNAGVFRCRSKEPSDFLPKLKDVTSLGTVRDHLTKAEKLRDNRDKFDIVLSTVAQADDALMDRLDALIDDYLLFLKETEATVADKLKDVPSDLDDTTSQLRAELELLASHWESMIAKP